MTVPVMTTWLRGLTAIHYCRHFDNFFKYNPDVLTTVGEACLGKTQLGIMGFVMDFSDAQFLGLGTAFGKWLLRTAYGDPRLDDDAAFLKKAGEIGQQFVEKYCKGCKFHYGQSVKRVCVHVTTDDAQRSLFKKLAFEWIEAPLVAAEGAASAKQVLASIKKKFPKALKWAEWWDKRAHLIVQAEMRLAKRTDIMATAPSTDNNLEAFHSTFQNVCPRTQMPLCLGVNMAYNYVENCRHHAESIVSGKRKAKRKRGKQHDTPKLPREFTVDEWNVRCPEKSRQLKPSKKAKK
jgi:hypothetical protein